VRRRWKSSAVLCAIRNSQLSGVTGAAAGHACIALMSASCDDILAVDHRSNHPRATAVQPRPHRDQQMIEAMLHGRFRRQRHPVSAH
jgi:hypothetical protein